MNAKDAKKRVEKLREELNEHNYRYYALDQPTISDEKYDKLFKELQDLETEFPALKDPHSPTQRVGAEISAKFSKYKHREAMLSLNKVSTEEELQEAYKRLSKTVQDFHLVGEP